MLNRVEMIIKSKLGSNRSELYKELMLSQFVNFLDNEYDKYHKEALLEILDKIYWIDSIKVLEFIIKYINDNSLVLDFGLVKLVRTNLSSSSTNIYVDMLHGGMVLGDQLIDLSNENLNRSFQDYLIVDDFSGTGTKIIDTIDKFESKFINKKCHIIVYGIMESALENINTYLNNKKNTYIIKYCDILLRYDKIIKNALYINYINDRCKTTQNKKYEFGLQDTGSLVSLSGISPNNNVSLIWRSDLVNTSNNKWYRLLDRNLSIEIIIRKQKQLLSKHFVDINYFYMNNFKFRTLINYDEFYFLLTMYNSLNTLSQIKDSDYFRTNSEFDSILSNLNDKKVISINKGYLQFVNKNIKNELKNIMNIITNKDDFKNKNIYLIGI